jgi:hypothetical protein
MRMPAAGRKDLPLRQRRLTTLQNGARGHQAGQSSNERRYLAVGRGLGTVGCKSVVRGPARRVLAGLAPGLNSVGAHRLSDVTDNSSI